MFLRLLAILFAFALVAAACGDDDDTTTTDDPPAADDTGDDGGDGDEPPADDGEEPATDDDAMAEDDGDDAMAEDDGGEPAAGGDLADRYAPQGEATGEPIKVGFQNPEGDPAGSFPEYSEGARAAVAFINAELGGLGGRPIELDVCVMAITPDDSQRCANELSADGVELAMSSLNFFGNHFPIYQGSEIPVVVGTPITVGDFTSEGVFSVGAGGGCLGTHTAMVMTATQIVPEIEGVEPNRISVPWADTPPGVVCYYDLEAKPLDVLNGSVPGDSELAGTLPELEHIGVPVLPGSADVTAQATEVLDFDPDVIMYSAQGADCWTFVDAMGRLGWSSDETPLVLSGACIDFTAMEQAGELAEGIYFVGSPGQVTGDLETIEGDQDLLDATIYQTKAIEYGMSEDDLFKGFGTQGWSLFMNTWLRAQEIVAAGGEVTGQSLADAFAATDDSPAFGSPTISCAQAPEPYVAVCNPVGNVTQWDGTSLVLVDPLVSGIDLVAGTELKPGPE